VSLKSYELQARWNSFSRFSRGGRRGEDSVARTVF
jgi:hypothetical protein